MRNALHFFNERLTGIKQSDVENAPSTEQALAAFLEWIPEEAVLVSWSNSDAIQIYNELDGKGIVCIDVERLEDLLYDSIDCQEEFDCRLDSPKSYSLSNALSISGVDCEITVHDALTDAKNTALLFAKLETEPELKLSSYYLTEADMRTYAVPFRPSVRA